MTLKHRALQQASQRELIEFLQAELAIGPTFANSAMIAEQSEHHQHYAQAKRNASLAAKTVRKYIGRVSNSRVRSKIERQLERLDRLVSNV